MRIQIQARQPFSLSSVLRSHGWIQLAPFRSDESYERMFYVDQLSSGRVIEMAVESDADGVVANVPELSEAEQDEVKQRLAWMLDLDLDLTAFYALARAEPKLAHIVDKCGGRVLRCPTFFEDVVKTILTTNTLWGATKRMNSNLVKLYGELLADDPEKSAFPTAHELAMIPVEEMQAQARLGYRTPYVSELSKRAASGELDLEAIKSSDLPTLELRKQLLNIKGVGPYAAANLLMILGRYDYIPVDSWGLKLVSHEWYGGEPVTAKQVEQAFEQWGKWKGLAFWYWDWEDEA
jgi:3-methyladenine DNA glycosylase/8-oxoguanine DNA glycosylase